MNLRTLTTAVRHRYRTIRLHKSGIGRATAHLSRHPIGDAKSLPYVDLNYQKQSGSYDLKNLTATLWPFWSRTHRCWCEWKLSGAPPSTPARSAGRERTDHPASRRAANSDATAILSLAWFDVGYLAETYNQWFETGATNPANGLDGYACRKSLCLRGPDPDGIRCRSHHHHGAGART